MRISTWCLAAFLVVGCDAGPEPLPADGTPTDAEYGKPVLDVAPAAGKEDTMGGLGGPAVDSLDAETAVWTVEHAWDEITEEAGLAWSKGSGLTWEQKYSAWVASMQQTPATNGYDTTFELTTPWGRNLPAPRLECAETAMFLRATFAAWHHLPFYLSAYHPTYGGVHFGHFGVVRQSGRRIPGYAKYGKDFVDHTPDWQGRPNDELLAAWPADAALAKLALTDAKDDRNTFLGSRAYAGAYFDRVFLNKRAGHFMLHLLTSFGSMHLADAERNTYHAKARTIRAGDVLLQRWQKEGIGHTVVVKSVTEVEGDLAIETVYGSMPRIQPRWYGAAKSEHYFTSSYSGGPATNDNGDSYARLGGGLKRWRAAVIADGRWHNAVPDEDLASYIRSTDYYSIGQRILDFKALLGKLTPEAARDLRLEQIASARSKLEKRPASCLYRARREEAFAKLYSLTARHFAQTRAEADREHRTLADYVLAELDYDRAKTCCWNSTNSQMYQLIMELNEARVADETTGMCSEPIVFKASGGGYEAFAEYAASVGKGHLWANWRADEYCPQADTVNDVEVAHAWSGGYCSLAAPATTDAAADGCGDTTWEGHCDGNTVVWCEDGRLVQNECESGETCGWAEDDQYYWCLAD